MINGLFEEVSEEEMIFVNGACGGGVKNSTFVQFKNTLKLCNCTNN